jgi:lactoylglutathione lyase
MEEGEDDAHGRVSGETGFMDPQHNPVHSWETQMAAKQASTVPIKGLAHIGVRVHDMERSVRFYALFGFEKTAGPIGPEPVAILEHPSGLELNLILNAPSAAEPNILMDVPQKHPGITHFALLCDDILSAKARLEAAGIALSGGPMRLGQSAQAIFVRDPDRNVIELHQRVAGT